MMCVVICSCTPRCNKSHWYWQNGNNCDIVVACSLYAVLFSETKLELDKSYS